MLNEYSSSDFTLGFIQQGDKAFKDKITFLMYDVPLAHRGAF